MADPKHLVPSPAPTRRQEASGQRRQAILDAGLDVFATNGFASAKLDEVAERAGVAKGTIYLFFKDKEDLFEQIVLGAVAPILAKAEVLAGASDQPFESALAGMFELFRTEVLATKRREIARLVIAEGGRFPAIAAFYHRELIAKMLALVRQLAERARDRGEAVPEAIVRFPHLVAAPMLLSLIWDGLYSKFEPLDVKGLLAAHHAILTSAGPPGKRKTP